MDKIVEVVGVIIKNNNNEYLLQLRDEKASSFRHCWTLFGGRIEAGEQPEEALKRELKEELKFSPKAIKSIDLIQTNTSEDGMVQYIFEIATNVKLEELMLGEGAAMEYVSEASLFDRRFAFNIKEVINAYMNKKV
ncbi:NUDIX domain-containing protein [Candidatus Saccharibacteria bacterium]|nr:NUDIX domain-containing protein [Candidatus Saccharibacteria bacterium]